MNNSEKGKKGERLVQDYLTGKGCKILDENFRFHHREIDIIAVKDDTLIFVEVKARNNEKFGKGVESIGDRKIRNIISVARYYIHKNRLQNLNVRFDVASIDNNRIWYIEDAFNLKSCS